MTPCRPSYRDFSSVLCLYSSVKSLNSIHPYHPPLRKSNFQSPVGQQPIKHYSGCLGPKQDTRSGQKQPAGSCGPNRATLHPGLGPLWKGEVSRQTALPQVRMLPPTLEEQLHLQGSPDARGGSLGCVAASPLLLCSCKVQGGLETGVWKEDSLFRQ